jgi:hypothetical protein
MSTIEAKETKSRVCICDETIDVDARLDCRDDVDRLIERIQYAADFMWPAEACAIASAIVGAEAAAAEIAESIEGGLTQAADEPQPPRQSAAPALDDQAEAQDESAPPLTLAEILAQAKDGPLTVEAIDRVVAEQLADDEFEKLSPAQAEAVALKRIGLSALQTAVALGVPSEQSIWARLSKAKERGVTVERERAA